MQKILHIWNGMVKGFSKMYNFSFFGQIFFCKHFYYITGFCNKKFNFCKFANIFADSKSRAQELSNDVSFVIFGHQTWDLERGSNIYQHILVFKYPSRDRVNKQFSKSVYNDCKIIYKRFESSISKSDQRRNWNVFLHIFVFRHITYKFKSIFFVLYFSSSFFLIFGQVTIKNWSDFWIW